jgi:hypothetical protein
MPEIVNLVICLAVGCVGGIVGSQLKVPAGTLTGSIVFVILFKLMTQQAWAVPKNYNFVCQILLGVLIASSFTPGMFKELGQLVLPVTLSALILMVTGLMLTFLFVKIGWLDFPTAYLGTNPGAMSAMIPMAADASINATTIFCFHFFRILLIALIAPFLFKILS